MLLTASNVNLVIFRQVENGTIIELDGRDGQLSLLCPVPYSRPAILAPNAVSDSNTLNRNKLHVVSQQQRILCEAVREAVLDREDRILKAFSRLVHVVDVLRVLNPSKKSCSLPVVVSRLNTCLLDDVYSKTGNARVTSSHHGNVPNDFQTLRVRVPFPIWKMMYLCACQVQRDQSGWKIFDW